ncbi:MAG: aminotransferase class III-fold pyridoxal phosphate-dependent enzyme, partial [Candidatus Methylomirabilis sp.]|nr:aminotransferase class III-fold pyridoxal phosphate-dependent enzyme [Deltaproteobacteria bacterium]
ELADLRGRGLYLPLLGSGFGAGSRVELADGSWKLDFIGGIGPLLFGHGDPDLLRVALEAALTGPPNQGHLQPGPEYLSLGRALAPDRSARLRYAWICNSGTMANEFALKAVRQKRAGAAKIVAFEGAFAGRSTLTQEITDRPEYREGQPLTGDVLRIPFFDPEDDGSVRRSADAFNALLARHGREIACLMVEFVQGEGGLHAAPRDFFLPLFEAAREAGVAILADEVQTFGRTGELYAYEKLGLGDWVDVVTVGKVLQCAAVLFTEEMNPRPGLVSATFAASTVPMAVGARIVERLRTEDFLGPRGRFAAIERMVLASFEEMRRSLEPHVDAFGALGAMAWLRPFGGDPDKVKAVVREAYRRGLLVFTCGRRNERVRMLLPGGVMTDEEWREGAAILAGAIEAVAKADAHAV